MLVFVDADVRLVPARGRGDGRPAAPSRPRPGQPVPAPARRGRRSSAWSSRCCSGRGRACCRCAWPSGPPRPSLSAANGQLMAVDAGPTGAPAGTRPSAREVLDDVALVRRVKAIGGRGGVADGTSLATCRMYDDREDLVEGWTKSLWSATGHPAGAAALVGLAGAVYVLPPLAALRGSRWGAAGYAAAVLGRALVARRTGRTRRRRLEPPCVGGRLVPAGRALVARPLRRLAHLEGSSAAGRPDGTVGGHR